MRDSMTRRQALVGTGALVSATTVGIATHTQEASATVSGEFAIPNGETVLADQELQDVRLSVNPARWSYTANAPLHAIELELLVGATADTLDLIARHTRDDMDTDELSGEAAMNGSLMSASDFSIDDFQPSNGELRRTVMASLRFYALRNEEVVAEAQQTDTFDVVVKDEALQVDMSLGGDGEVSFETG
jgi:hypothetical protein